MSFYKLMLLAIFFAALLSLGSGLYFLVRDKGQKSRTANALLLRVVLCALLIGMIIYGITYGHLQPHSPTGLIQ